MLFSSLEFLFLFFYLEYFRNPPSQKHRKDLRNDDGHYVERDVRYALARY